MGYMTPRSRYGRSRRDIYILIGLANESGSSPLRSPLAFNDAAGDDNLTSFMAPGAMYCLARLSRAGNDRDVQSGDRILRCGRASAVIAEKAI
jgi:hypothetical protein